MAVQVTIFYIVGETSKMFLSFSTLKYWRHDPI